MPQGSFRWCGTPECRHRWFVALPLPCSCPRCGAMVADASDGWPHVCSAGHGAQHGGKCLECELEQARKVTRKELRSRR